LHNSWHDGSLMLLVSHLAQLVVRLVVRLVVQLDDSMHDRMAGGSGKRRRVEVEELGAAEELGAGEALQVKMSAAIVYIG
jgi:hypothetical protein